MSTDPRDDRVTAAGEYVLGTLDPAAHAAFERALERDEGLQAEVYAWQDRLLGLAARVAPVEPDAVLWAGIDARLESSPAHSTVLSAAPSAVAAAGPAANDPSWRRLRRWQFASGIGLAASLVLATLLVLRGPAEAPLPSLQAGASRYLAVLQAPADHANGWIVEVTAGGMLRLVPIASGTPVPAGKTLQFWTKAESAPGPTSLGLVHAGEVVQLPASRVPALGVRQLFELTLEPEAGSPIDRPTGPVLFIGRAVQL